MKIRNLFLICALLAPQAGCSSKPERPDPPEGYFATYIAEDGTKKFQYTLELDDPGSSQRGKRPANMAGHVSGGSGRGVSGGVTAGSGSRSGGPPSGSGYEQFQQVNKQLENMLERELGKSGFCHRGHRETERVVEPPTVYIRGECKEAAADADRVAFPNNIE